MRIDRVDVWAPMIGGRIEKPSGPGFGMELNMESVKHYQLHYKSHLRK